MKENVLVLTLDSDAFSKLKEDFNTVLKRTLGNMESKESKEATLTLKLNITLRDDEVPDFDSADKDAKRKIHKPRFDHKISSVMQIKSEESGSLNGEYELVWDNELNDYVMKAIDNGQGSLFDDEIYACVVEVQNEGQPLPSDQPLPSEKKLLGSRENEELYEELYDDYQYDEGFEDE